MTDSYLRAKIATLTHYSPENRRSVYKFVKKEGLETEGRKMIVERILMVKNGGDVYGGILSPLIKNTTPVRNGNGLK